MGPRNEEIETNEKSGVFATRGEAAKAFAWLVGILLVFVCVIVAIVVAMEGSW